MKITKEKVVYFLSLNLISYLFFILFCIFYSIFIVDFGSCIDAGCPEIDGSESTLNFLIEGLVVFVPVVFFVSIFSFIYNYLTKEKYNIFINTILISLLPVVIFLVYFVLFIFTGNYTDNTPFMMFLRLFRIEVFLDFFQYLFLAFISNLIILKITDPLRRKIKW